VRTARDIIALAKTRPGEILFGSLGSGTLAHLELELLQNVAKVKFTHIPYKGSAPAKTDLTAGHIQLLFDSIASSGGLIQAGKLRPIAIASSVRSGSLPEVPTFVEGGLKDFQANNWYGLLAPAGTPKAALDRLATELPKILAMPDIRQRFSSQGMDVASGDAATLAGVIRSDLAQWTPIVRQSGAKID
jgi:tripartite-type tricarboxylate transporter receptor subunit TctC